MDPEKKSSASEYLIPEAQQIQKTQNLHGDESQVYIVMPKQTYKTAAAQPTIKVSDNSFSDGIVDELPVQKPGGESLLTYLKIFILLVAAAGLGLAGYHFGPDLYTKYFKDNNSSSQNSSENSKGSTESTATPNPAQKSDTLPAEWLQKFFGTEKCGKETECGSEADPDFDGLTNLGEYRQGTDANNADSDGDGISDGDEVFVFMTNPLKKYSFDDPKFSDSDYLKGGYDINTSQLLTQEKLLDIKNRMKDKGLHPPTINTLGDSLKTIFDFGGNPAPAQPPQATATPSSTPGQALSGFEITPEAQQDRDAQRTTSIKNIGIGLVKYYEANNSYPKTSNFKEMYEDIRVFMKIAINPQDPVNKEPYVYAYAPNAAVNDFTLSFYSEVVKQLIKKHAADAQKDKTAEEAAISDDQRINDLKRLQTALLLYSSKQSAGNQNDVFPSAEKYKTELLTGGDISDIPKDPKTQNDYEYKVSDTFDTFTLKTILDNPSAGSTGYMCNQLECDFY